MNFAAKAGCDVSEREIAEHKKRERGKEREGAVSPQQMRERERQGEK